MPEFNSGIDYHTVTFYFIHPETGELGEKLGENQIKILKLVAMDRTITIAKIAETIGISTTAVENNIAKLKSKGLLRRAGSDTKGYWEMINKK